MKIFVLYIPGLDRRLISFEQTPYVYNLLRDFPSSRIRTLPSTELVPTLLTGVYPHQNRVLQVSLKKEPRRSLNNQFLNLLPDFVSTLWQCFYSMFDKRYELPTVPWYRRHQFNFHRIKYTRRQENSEVIHIIGGIPSLFYLLDKRSRYIFIKQFNRIKHVLPSLPSADVAFDFLEFYALDLFSHWNLDRHEAFVQALQFVDSVVANFHENCKQKAVTFLLLVDHGQERIKGTINLTKLFKSTELPKDEYLYFMEVSCTRLWFKTNRTRQKMLEMLEGLDHITVLDHRQMYQYNICLDDETFGEVFIFPDHGYIFFPHDFYHPLANIFLALSNSEQRPRLFNPRHRGNHGHLPDHPSEEGYIILMDKNYETCSEVVNLIDFAPSILALLEKPKPEYMRGKKIFIHK